MMENSRDAQEVAPDDPEALYSGIGSKAKNVRRQSSIQNFLDNTERRTLIFLGAIFWLMIIIVAAAVTGVMVSSKKSANASPTPTASPTTTAPSAAPTDFRLTTTGTVPPTTAASSTPGCNSLYGNPFKPGHLFGTGFQEYENLEIRKDILEVINVCYPKCEEDEKCSGFGYRIDDRFDIWG
jgi:hypothetical protein